MRYLARSGLFRWPLLATLFRQVGAIPVYRRDEGAEHTRRNAETFEKVYELFEAGGCVGIFPEGRSSPAGRVGRLRSGAARMALGVEARNGYALGLQIVPVGITFESRELLMSAVLLRFGTPIAVADYADLHRRAPDAAIRQLTADLQRALQRQTLHIEDRQTGEMAADLAAVLGAVREPAPAAAVDDACVAPGARAPLAKRWLWRLAVSARLAGRARRPWTGASTASSGSTRCSRTHASTSPTRSPRCAGRSSATRTTWGRRGCAAPCRRRPTRPCASGCCACA
ncbi:MAG: 1-acyl-sn-glycerol-3-phosphate acyltransferase [Halofilum sp. (in: g-proteobacteria)]|nr:1-acyl-sn-glycerol-3-phosphate acyltransferase [Halofilum sp. (in: g-proteobacteria)]